MDDATRAELANRWAYRANLEHAAAARFRQLADRMAAAKLAPVLVTIANRAVDQERVHVGLCAEIAERFGAKVELPEIVLEEIAPASMEMRDRVVYEMVAFCCITETANASVVSASADDVDDAAIRRSVKTILADEVQHSRLGWQFLATHPLDANQRAWLGSYLPDMLEGTIRADLFSPQPIVGDEATMQKYGTLPVEGRRWAFLVGMREVCLPGMARAGIDVRAALAFLDQLEARIAPQSS